MFKRKNEKEIKVKMSEVVDMSKKGVEGKQTVSEESEPEIKLPDEKSKFEELEHSIEVTLTLQIKTREQYLDIMDFKYYNIQTYGIDTLVDDSSKKSV